MKEGGRADRESVLHVYILNHSPVTPQSHAPPRGAPTEYLTDEAWGFSIHCICLSANLLSNGFQLELPFVTEDQHAYVLTRSERP
jgi:hypothetical protein